ncbi:hypothetical protein [Alteribacter aurantiacus]|uniref:hypothetical protein n=1 Tax=Alteribacter aurantiacus TaxID=254410 RepID=UPI0003F5AE74|nr:hypothetical protein [Alteribacter aurantiacus]
MSALRKITGLLVLLAILTVACNSAEEEARESFESFVDALDRGAISEVVDYVTDDFVESEFGVPKEAFEEEGDLIDEQMGELLSMFDYQIISFEVSSETDEEIVAAYEISITEEETGDEQTEGGTVTFINTDSDWLIDQMEE